MSKRFTDTGKWKDPWFATLRPAFKLLWLFIIDECDHAGIWKVNMELARYHIGKPFVADEVLKAFEHRVQPFDDGAYWLVVKFVEFQYGRLKPASPMHQSIVRRLAAFGLDQDYPASAGWNHTHPAPTLPLPCPQGGGRVKEKEKEEDKEKEKEKEKVNTNTFTPPTIEEIKAYGATLPHLSERECEKFFDYYQSNGWMVGKGRMKDWKAALRNWSRRREEEQGGLFNEPDHSKGF